MSASREELAVQIDTITWPWLRPHYQREALFLVAPELDLATVAAAVANDDTALVREWLECGTVRRPNLAEVDAWEEQSQQKFSMVIVQPFVLIAVATGD